MVVVAAPGGPFWLVYGFLLNGEVNVAAPFASLKDALISVRVTEGALGRGGSALSADLAGGAAASAAVVGRRAGMTPATPAAPTPALFHVAGFRLPRAGGGPRPGLSGDSAELAVCGGSLLCVARGAGAARSEDEQPGERWDG